MKILFRQSGIIALAILTFLFISCNPKPKQDRGKETTMQVGNAIKVTFIELGSVNCIPCKKMRPVMDSIEKKYSKQVKVVFHDVWTEAGAPYGQKYGIESIPTQVFLDANGKEYFRHVGFFPEEDVVTVLKMKGVN
jgi:thioredoxin 1